MHSHAFADSPYADDPRMPFFVPRPSSRFGLGVLTLLRGAQDAVRLWCGIPSAHATTVASETSRLKIERYSFSMSPKENFRLGTHTTFDATLQPNTRLRPRRITANAPCPNFVLLDSLQVANVNLLVGTTEDAFTYNANGQGALMDIPPMDPANHATMSGFYTGLVPSEYHGTKHHENLGPEPPPDPPRAVDPSLFEATEEDRAKLEKLLAYQNHDERAYLRALRAYTAEKHPDRIRTWEEPFSFQFIMTFAGPSTIVDNC